MDFSDYLGSGIDSDIFHKLFNTTTQVWSATEVISTESTGDSFSPHLAIDQLDNIHIIWQDKTDYAGAGTDWDIFYNELVNLNTNVTYPFLRTPADYGDFNGI